ncbi:MAG: hypothetical protein O3A10_11015 [Chloroflexi bacterium]|nr:hypothetical protein [Chloroflexota bacterium]MDA1146265.1 hypothetical protein [Chloroflexota bacterium]
MLPLLRSSLHHSEAIDPTLAEWIRNEIDDLVGLEPSSIVAILGVVILAFPLWLGVAAIRRQRRAASEAAIRSAHEAHQPN